MKKILICAYCGKKFKTKEPIINVCNKCCKKNEEFLKELKSNPYLWINYFYYLSKHKK